MKKRKLALACVVAVAALALVALAVLRTAWAGERLCGLAEARVRQATGLRLALRECRVEPFLLEVRASDVRLGPEGAPVFAADAVRVRLAPVQAMGRRLEVAELEVRGPRVVAALPAAAPGAGGGPCPPPLLRQFEVRRLDVQDGRLDLTLPGGARVTVDRVDVRSVKPQRRHGVQALTVRGAPRAGLEVALAGARVDAGGRRLAVDALRVNADLALDLSRLDVHAAAAELPGGVAVAATGVVEQLCRPRLDLTASLRGELPAILAALGRPDLPTRGGVALDVHARGPAARPVIDAEVGLRGAALDGWRPGDVTARLRLDGPELRVDALDVSGGPAGGRLAARGTLRLGKPLALDARASLDGFELGDLLSRLQLPGAWVMARVSGEVRARGTVAPLQLEADAGLDLADFRVLDHAWERWTAGEQPILELRRARVEGPVRVDREGVHLAGVRVRAGEGAVAVDGALHFRSARGFELRVGGAVDLTDLRHVAPVAVGGHAELQDVVVRAAPYGVPRVTGQARARDLRLLRLDLGEAAASVGFDEDLVLRFSGVQGRRGVTRYRGDVAVDLGRGPTRISEARYTIDGRLRDAFEAVMPWLPDAVHARDALDGDVALRGTARGRPAALDATFEGELGAGTLSGRAFDGGRVAGRIEGGARAVFEVAELRRGAGSVRGSGWIDLDAPHAWSLAARAEAVRLEDLDLPGPAWSGALSGDATVGGSWQQPALTFAARGDRVAVADVPLDAARVEGQLRRGELSGFGTARGVRASGTARLDGDAPFQARAELDLDDAVRLWRGAPAAAHARVRGVAAFSGALAGAGAVAGELHLDELDVTWGDLELEQAAPVVLALEEGRVVVRALALRGANTQLALSGSRERGGALVLDARGSMDLRLLEGLVPGVTEPRGQLEVEAHVGGTLQDPLLVGAGRLRDAGFQARDLSVDVAQAGGALAFSQNRVLFDRLDAVVNGGRAQLDGEIELRRLLPQRLRVGATLEDVPLHLPSWLPTVVAGRLQVAGAPDAMLLSGKLHVLQARYTEPVDLERRLLDPRRAAPPKPLDRAGGWLALDVGLVVDGDARVDNDLVHGAFTGDLTLTGTVASVGLVGTLMLRDGARGTFRGNEFVLKHGVLDFSDRNHVRMSLDVNGDAQVNEYLVTLHLFGPYQEPTLQLTSQPALSQRDIVTLLSLGYTTRDTAAVGGTTGVATAAAAQALFSASGLDDQVKRFVPRNDVLRDFSVRITSAYSEASGQVEPRAELESRLLDDRFRLRYQAPLANSRGQRAQAEMKLSAHTSVQYQWDNESPDVVSSGGDHGLDLKLRWEWTE